MTNAPNPFGSDQQEFIEFMEATVEPGFLYKNVALFAARHPLIMKSILANTLRITRSLTTETFWSGHAYLMGRDRAVKFNLSPNSEVDVSFIDPVLEGALTTFERTLGRLASVAEWIRRQTAPISQKLDPDYLKKDLWNRANINPIRYVLSAQIAVNNELTPIEDAFQEWQQANSPSMPIADLVFDVQDASLLHGACERLFSFSPGKYHSEHRPLGNMGRGRIFTYDASQRGRKAQKDPARIDELWDLATDGLDL